MRLIAVDSFIVKDFIGDDTPPYAILSHTWGPGEVTLQDMHVEFGGGDEDPYAPRAAPRARASTKEGFRKIRHTCGQAAKDSLAWAWVDTCCIDKTSSAELSEAINSMYRWYNQAQMSYAYLTDVSLDRDSGGVQAVGASRWLTRGFTLQELLAPRDIVFYNVHWARIGTRNRDLRRTLADATGIDYDCLGSGDHARLANYSIATRMSWASRRSCTRTEDVAYCLMGIFDINMPMLYGEGKRAFFRLQEEILKETEDHSLFAWAVPEGSDRAWCLVGALAESPSDFAGSGNVKCPRSSSRGISALDKLGLSIELGEADPPSKQEAHHQHFEAYGVKYFTLDCSIDDPNDVFTSRVIIPLLANTAGVDGDQSTKTPSFRRFSVPRIESGGDNFLGQRQRVYIRKKLSTQERRMFRHGSIFFRGLRPNECGLSMIDIEDESDYFVTFRRADDIAGIVHIVKDLRLADAVKWKTIQFVDRWQNYFTLAIGLGPDTLHFYIQSIETLLGRPKHRDRSPGPSSTCVNWWAKHGRLAFDEFILNRYLYRAEIFHDEFSSLQPGRVYLLVKFSLVKDLTIIAPPKPPSQDPAAPAQRKSVFQKLLGSK